MLNHYKRLLDRIGAIEQAFGIALIAIIVVSITVQVFTRYALNRPIAWVEETATYAFIWMVFVGASLGLKKGRHIFIATFGGHLPARVEAAMRVCVWLLTLGTLVVLVQQGIKVMGIEGRSNTISLPIELPRSWFYSLPLTASSVSMAFTTLWLLFDDLAIMRGRSTAIPTTLAPMVGPL